ncbi:MAG: hypothetical protein QW514_00690 [Thermoprotei archaeon]
MTSNPAYSGFKFTSHNNLRRIAIRQLLEEGYNKDRIQVDVDINAKRVDVFADGERPTIIECKSFKHTNEYASKYLKTEGGGRRILCQPFFDVDEMWLVYRTKKNKYIVIKVPRPTE